MLAMSKSRLDVGPFLLIDHLNRKPDGTVTGKGSHRQFVHPGTKKVITVAVHTKKDVGKGLERRILKDAGLDGD